MAFDKQLTGAMAHAGDANPEAVAAVRATLTAVHEVFHQTFPNHARDLAEVDDTLLTIASRAATLIRSSPSKALGGTDEAAAT